MPASRDANPDELKKLLDAMLQVLSWQEQLVYEALDTLKNASSQTGEAGEG